MNTLGGQRIKMIRSELNLNQKELADKIGATVSAVSNWECGRNNPNSIMTQRLNKLESGYHLSPDTVQKLIEYLEEKEKEFRAHEYSDHSIYSGFLGGHVHILNKIKEWENGR